MKGSITFFYACICIMLISLLGTTMESVRVYTARSMLSDSSYLALQNSLAGYQRELWDDYHILFMDVREIGGADALKQEICDNLAASWGDETSWLTGDWMGVSCTAEDVVPKRFMTEQKGAELQNQILAYMQYRGAADVAKQLLEQIGLITSLQKGRDFLNRKIKMEESFAGLEKKKNQMMHKMKNMSEEWKQLKERADFIQETWQQWGDEEMTLPPQPEVTAELTNLAVLAHKLQQESHDIQSACGSYVKEYQKTDEKRQEYEAWLKEEKESIQENIWQTLRADLDEIVSLQQDEISYVGNLEGTVVHNQEALQDLKDWCLQGNMEQLSAGVLTGYLERYKNDLLPDGYELPTGGDESANPFTALQEYASKGVLSLVLPAGTTVSDAVLKSSTWWEESKSFHGADILSEALSQPLLALYAGEHFGCYQETIPKTALQYEQEYLLIGSSIDSENLAGAVGELLLVRTMSDFLQIITKPDKVAKAREMAAAIAGVTGTSVLIPIFKTGILLLWSLEDAVKEVRKLLAGEKVPLYAGVSAFSTDYKGYLQLLLLAGSDKRNLRMAQLIEGNVRLRYEPKFSASDCAAAIQMELVADITPKFLSGMSANRLSETYELGYLNATIASRLYLSGS